jgi:hypothetical protein
MELMQLTALDTLSMKNLIAPERWAAGEVSATAALIPAPLSPRVAEANAQDADLLAFLDVLVTEYKFLGPNGLKDRTKLLEYRYDAV